MTDRLEEIEWEIRQVITILEDMRLPPPDFDWLIAEVKRLREEVRGHEFHIKRLQIDLFEERSRKAVFKCK
jgi:hypothetical protein